MYRSIERIFRVFLKSFLWIGVFEACATAQQSELMPASQSIAPAIVTADSAVKSGGSGKNWSKWYRLGVGKAPKGYTFEKTEFWLTGDRTCGVSAECRKLLSNDEQVLWEFRFQGNNQAGLAKGSQGHIRVIYRPQ